MGELAAQDAERMLRFVAAADELGGDEGVTPVLLEELGKLVEADWVSFCEQDRVKQRIRRCVWRTGDPPAESAVTYWEIADEHPVCSRHNRGDFRALKLSDFLTLPQLRKRRIYTLWFEPWGVNHELNVALPSPPWHTKTLLFDRRPGRDFTERDRRVLDLLQPHLARLWRGAHTRRRLGSAMESLASACDEEPRGVVFLDGGSVDFASPPALRMLTEYFGARDAGKLPAAVCEWLERGSEAFVWRQGSRRVTIHRSGPTLLLEESGNELGLTARECQVLSWVARGKTNLEVAQILWVAPSTVRKHLENVYAKLGVHTRTEAVARFLGVLDRLEPAS